MTISWIGIISFFHWATSEFCDAPLHIVMRQEYPATRPEGDVKLSCVLYGVHISSVERYRWSELETLQPIFDYMIPTQKQICAGPCSTTYRDEIHNFSSTIQSIIRVNVNLTNKKHYMCEFHTDNFTMCREKLVVTFQDPKIDCDLKVTKRLISQDGLLRPLIINVTCTVIASDGKPELQLIYKGPTGGQIYFLGEKELDMKQMNHSFNAAMRVQIYIPDYGELICTVTDLRGSYIKSIFVDLDDESEFHTPREVTFQVKSCNGFVVWYIFWPSVALQLCTVIPLLIYVSVLKKRLMNTNRKKGYKELTCQQASSEETIELPVGDTQILQYADEVHGSSIPALRRRTTPL